MAAAVAVLLGLCGSAWGAGGFTEPTVPAEWREKSPGQLVDVARELWAAGESKAADRSLLAQYLGYRLLSDPSQARSLSLGTWSDLTGRLDQDMTAEQKASWRAGLRSAFAGTQEAVCGLAEKDFLSLTYALRSAEDEAIASLWFWRIDGTCLTDAATIRGQGVTKWRQYVQSSVGGMSEADCRKWHAALTAAFIATPEAMAALSDEDFAGVTNVLRGLVKTTDFRALIVTRMTAQGMATVESARALGIQELQRRVATYSTAMPEEMKALWRSRMRAAFASDGAALAALADEDFLKLTAALRALQDDGLASLTLSRLTSTYLGDVAAIRAQGVAMWRQQFQACRSAMSEADCQAWHAALTSAFIPTPEAMASLSDEDFTGLTGVLRSLIKTTNIQALTATRMTAKDMATVESVKALGIKELQKRVANLYGAMTDEMRALWTSRIHAAFAADAAAVGALSDEEFAGLTSMLTTLKDGAVPGLKVTWLSGKYLKDAAATRSVSLRQWNSHVSACKAAMTDEVKGQWVAALRAAYAADDAAVAALSDEDFNQITWLLTGLGDKAAGGLIVARMTGWAGADVATVRARPLAEWAVLIGRAAAGMTDETRARWAAQLRGAYAADEAAVAALSDEDFLKLTTALGVLKDAGVANVRLSRVTSKYLGDAATVRAQGIAGWRQHVQACKSAMSEADCQAWHAALTAAFMATPEAMAALSDEDFTGLTGVLRSLVKTTNFQALTATRMTTRDMGTVESVKALGIKELQKRVANYYGAMTDEMRALWTSRIHAAFAADAAAVGALGDEDFGLLMQALVTLKDERVAGLKLSRLTGKYLKDAAATRSVSLREWVGHVSACRSAMTDDVKGQWIAALRAAYAPDDAAVAALSEEDFTQLVSLLSSLGDKQTNALLAARTTVGLLSDVTAVRAKPPAEWASLIGRTAGAMTDAMRAQWAAQLRAAFVEDAATLRAMTLKDVGVLVGVLRALKQDNADAVYASWVGAGDGWKACQGQELAQLAHSLALTGEAGQAARQQLLGWLAARMQENQASAKDLTLNQWDGISRELAADLSAEAKAVWAEGLRTAFAGNVEALGALTCEEYKLLATTLDRLGDVTVPALTKNWVEAGTAWRSLDVAGLGTVAYRLARLGQDGQTSRDRLADELASRLRADPASARAVGCQAWSGLVRAFTKDAASADKRAALAAALRAAFVENPSDLANLKAGDFQQLVIALKTLGDKETQDLARQYMEASEAWKNGNLSWFLQALPSSGPAAADARRSLAAQVEADYLAGPDAIRAVGLGTWVAIVTEVRAFLSPEASRRWADALRPALLGDDDGSTLSAGDFIAVVRIMKALDDANLQAVAKTWIANHKDQVAALSSSDLMTLVSTAFRRKGDEVADLLTSVDAAWAGKLTAGQATAADCRNLCYAWCAAGDRAQGVQWAHRMYQAVLGTEAARAAADVTTMTSLIGAMHFSGLLDFNTQDYPAFAQTAARLAREGQLDNLGSWQTYRHWGMLLNTPQSRATLQKELTDPQGLPRLPVCKLLAWAYREGGAAKEWEGVVDTTLANTGLSGDQKALWLIAKGHARSLAVDPWNFRRGKPSLDGAMAAAQTENVRLLALGERAEYCANIGRPDLGVQVVESVREQFSSEMSGRLDALCERLRSLEDARKAAANRRRAMSEQAMRHAELIRYKELLARESAKGNSTATARLQELITELEAMLGVREQ